jgi:hypothetical protein
MTPPLLGEARFRRTAMTTPPLVGGDAEQEILEIFLYYKSQAGDCLSVDQFSARWGKKNTKLTWQDFGPGMQSLIDKGFVERKEQHHDLYCLTEAGSRIM